MRGTVLGIIKEEANEGGFTQLDKSITQDLDLNESVINDVGRDSNAPLNQKDNNMFENPQDCVFDIIDN